MIYVAFLLWGTWAIYMQYKATRFRAELRSVRRQRDASWAAQEKMAQALRQYRSNAALSKQITLPFHESMLAALRAHEKEVRERG